MNPRHPLLSRAERTADKKLERLSHFAQRTAAGTEHDPRAQAHDAQPDLLGLFSFFLPFLAQQTQKISAGRRFFSDDFIAARAVVTDRGSVDEKSRFLLNLGAGLNQAMSRIDTAVLDAAALRGSPFFPRDRLAGEIDHAVDAVQCGVPVPHNSGSPMNPALGADIAALGRAAGKQRERMALIQQRAA